MNNNVRVKSFGESIKGVGIGFILILVGGFLLAFNEHNNVKNIADVAEARSVVVQIPSASVDSANEGKLVSTNGEMVVIDENVTDPLFNIKAHTAKLVRTVKMYQWQENRHETAR